MCQPGLRGQAGLSQCPLHGKSAHSHGWYCPGAVTPLAATTSSITELHASCLRYSWQVSAGPVSLLHLLPPLLQHLPGEAVQGLLWHHVASACPEVLYAPLLQFQSFSQYRGKMAHKTAHELELLRDCVGVWDVNTVLQILQSLIDKSQVGQKLSNEGEQPVS